MQSASISKHGHHGANKSKKRMKKIGLAMTEEMYAALDNLKTLYFTESVPALCRIALTRWLSFEKEERERKEKKERMAKEALEQGK